MDTNLKNGIVLYTVTVNSALQDFIKGLEELPAPRILTAHNGKKFDFPILYRHFKDTMDTATVAITGLADSLSIAK
jgi:hypothetical protein